MRVLIVDRHRMFGEAISSYLQERGVEIVGVVQAAAAASRAASTTRPDVAVVDVGAADGDGYRAGREIARTQPSTRLVALARTADHETVERAIDSGFRGFLTRDGDVQQLLHAIRAVSSGEVVMPAEIGRGIARTWGERRVELVRDRLTPREKEVLRMIAAAATSDDIARRLAISVNTIRSHVQSIFTKLQVHSRLEAVAVAERNGLLDPSPPPAAIAHHEERMAAG